VLCATNSSLLARGLVHYFSEEFPFLRASLRALLQEFARFRKLASKDLQYFDFLPTQRATFGLHLDTRDRVEQPGTYRDAPRL